ncbi:hypothetical protein ACQPW1_39825 [Nocardia sp. CA-128927]|uniref:hypothetical protein n=1 Tax=Nocardia sp. CA-128927 TaxID=3239975 RepID=UPI003D988291
MIGRRRFAAYAVCPDCDGTGAAVGGFEGEDCPTCWGTGEVDDNDGTAEWDRARDRATDAWAGVW